MARLDGEKFLLVISTLCGPSPFHRRVNWDWTLTVSFVDPDSARDRQGLLGLLGAVEIARALFRNSIPERGRVAAGA
jgi:hypothetical protein